MKGLASIVIGGVVVASVGMAPGTAFAQTNAEQARAEAALRQSRYQIGQLERLLEGAVEHGLNMVRERLQSVAQMPVTAVARWETTGFARIASRQVKVTIAASPGRSRRARRP